MKLDPARHLRGLLTASSLLSLVILGFGCASGIAADGVGVLAVGIVEQPKDLNVQVGSAAAFFIKTDPPDASKQWLSNGVPIQGATGATLAWTNVQESHVAFYSCKVGSGTSSLLSRPAALNTYVKPMVLGGRSVVPVCSPFPGAGAGSVMPKPCSQTVRYLAVVRIPSPSSAVTPLSFGWRPPPGAIGVRLSDRNTSPPGYRSFARILQHSPSYPECAEQTVTFPRLASQPTTYEFSLYVTAPATLPPGTPIRGSVEWIFDH